MTADTFNGHRVRHGTNSGWRLHWQLGERPCDPCYFAKKKYDAERRKQPEQIKRSRAHARAQQRAYQRLAHRFHNLYRQYYQEEKVKAYDEAGLSL